MFILFVQTVSAVPELTAWHTNPKTGTDAGEIFELKFEILSDETSNYTIMINPGTKFSTVDENNSMTINIPKDETRTFIFNMIINEELEDGKHVIYYNASKEDVQFKSGKTYVRAGVQAPGFELIVCICAIIFIIFLMKKHRK
jgi:hypothetical protein